MPSSTATPTDLVCTAYDAFARGDIPAVLEVLDPGVVWVETAGGPYAGTYHGPQAVLEGVFGRLGGDWDGFVVEPETVVAQGGTVVAVGTYRGTHHRTGVDLTARFAHLWETDGGRARRFEQVMDTATMNAAAGVTPVSDAKRIAVTRTVDAPADRLFAVLADPAQHTTIDGSGLLRGSDSGVITGAGQVFVVDMFREDLGSYRVLNTITEFERDRRIGWAPNLDPECALAAQLAGTLTTGGHTYVYELAGRGDTTEVSQIYDWSGVRDPNFEAYCPFVTREQLMATLDRLADAVAR